MNATWIILDPAEFALLEKAVRDDHIEKQPDLTSHMANFQRVASRIYNQRTGVAAGWLTVTEYDGALCLHPIER